MQETVCCRNQGGELDQGRGHRDREVSAPPQKRQRLLTRAEQLPHLQGVHVGDGVVTRRRIPKVGCVGCQWAR